MTDEEFLDEYKQALSRLISYQLNSVTARKKLFHLGLQKQEQQEGETYTTSYGLHISCDWQILQNEKLIYHHPILKATLRKGKEALEVLFGKSVKSYLLSSPDLLLALYFEDEFQLRILLKEAKDYYQINETFSRKFPRTRRAGGHGSQYLVQEGKVSISFWIS